MLYGGNAAHQLIDHALLRRFLQVVTIDGVVAEHALLLALQLLSIVDRTVLAAIFTEDESLFLIAVTDFAFYNGCVTFILRPELSVDHVSHTLVLNYWS